MPRSPALPPAPALPKNPWTLRRLVERGVVLEALPGEEPEFHVARLETALMALFRDERGEQAFQALHELAQPALAVWIAGLAGGRIGAQDVDHVVQDTFVNIYRYAASFRDDQPRSFRVWSRTIASNVLRRARARRRTIALESFPAGLQEPRDDRADPSIRLVEHEENDSLAAAWAILLCQYAEAARRLAPRDRMALDLIEVQGLSYAEASERLGVRLSNMKMILFRARRRIRAAIGGTFTAREEKARRLAS